PQLGAGRPSRMRAARNTIRQKQFAYRAVSDPGSVADHAVRGVGIHVGGEGDQVAVVFTGGADPWGHRGLAPVDTVTERDAFLVSGVQVVFDQSVEEEPARFSGS